MPAFPFWLINLLMGLTPMGAGRFYVVSQAGMLAGTAVYVNPGTQLAAIHGTTRSLTLAKANRYVAGNGTRAHAPHKLLAWLGRYHAWERA